MTDEASSPRILLVEDDHELRHVLKRLLRERGGWDLVDAPDGEVALQLAAEHRPDLVITDYALPGIDGIAVARAVKAIPGLDGTLAMLLSGVATPGQRADGLSEGVDAFVTKPVDGAELIAGVRALLRLKAAHDAARTEAAAAAQAHAALERAFDQLLHLLVHLLDLARPGAADRGRRLASAAIALAQRSDIAPAWHRDLELAALLWEIGDLGASRTRNSEDGVDQPPWRRAVVAREILADVDRLRPVATIVDAIYEHWDGTGFPGHMQRGEIPFRSRLLRVLIDFFAMSDQGLEPAQAIERLMHHAGTRYDPALLVQLTDWTHGEAGASALTRRFVAVDELRVGMVLAEDLMTTSGTMLLTTGAIITPGSLLFIQRRHASDPILTGPYIAR